MNLNTSRKVDVTEQSNKMLTPVASSSKVHDVQKSSNNASSNKKSLQNKSQFRTIAPKGGTVVASAVFPCQPSLLPDGQTNQISTTSPNRSIVLPTQNYALMQVAGKEGTYSLVALPQVASALQSPQLQKTPPENLKLPIPRYPPTRNKAATKKCSAVSTSDIVPSTVLTQGQTASSPQAQPLNATAGHSETLSNIDATEQVILIDPGSAEITVATLLSENSSVDSGPSTINKTEEAKTDILMNLPDSAVLDESSSPLIQAKVAVKSSSERVMTDNEPTKNLAPRTEKPKQLFLKSDENTNNMTVLSPAIFGNAVQIIPSVPQEKVQNLQYSEVESNSYPNPNQNSNSVTAPTHQLSPEPNNVAACTSTGRSSDKLVNKSYALSAALQVHHKKILFSSVKAVADGLQKLGGNTGKKRGRKKKTPEEILATEAKRKKSIIVNRLKENESTAKLISEEPMDKTVEALKKYRCIMPKPTVILQPLAPITSPADPRTTQVTNCIDQQILLSNTIACKTLNCKQCGSTCAKHASCCRNVPFALSKYWYKCHVCSRSFQFKHHLQDHLNTHTNRRPYSCRICRKTYVHSGSLSTHMKLHHSEGRLKKMMRCEFCAKVFGHVGVYFGHLKEVHKVLLNIEPHRERQEEGNTTGNAADKEKAIERDNATNTEEVVTLNHADQVELQIKCGRCQVTVPTFADMKLHLLYSHGEEIQVRLKEGVLQESREAEQELVKHAAHYWKQLNERRNLLKCGSPEDEFYSFSKLKRQMYLHHQEDSEILLDCTSEELQTNEMESIKRPPWTVLGSQYKEIQFWTSSGFNCILCNRVLESKEELFNHWQNQHSCEDPAILWAIFSSYVGLPSENFEKQSNSREFSEDNALQRKSDLHVVGDECPVHSTSNTDTTNVTLANILLTCPLCTKRCYCCNDGQSEDKEIKLHQSACVHQCPKCLSTFTMTV
ncbi:zinc finger protein 438 isoform X1 [Latimeria chalumnae]|uniref:zinc finger protein 438 isoform X1 n=2 Tax=Latimeria chalumnae TaxID=7897 RepID=UPI00313E043C